MTLQPSYQQGFAPRDYEPLYPQLWSGCVGAWAPCLGATGTVLRDLSGYGNHGTLTNMDPGSDWVVSGGKGALDFNGVNDFTSVTNGPKPTTAMTVSAWAMTRTVSSGEAKAVIFPYGNGTWQNPYFSYQIGRAGNKPAAAFATSTQTYFLMQLTGVTTLTTNTWYSLIAVFNNGIFNLYVNGKFDSTKDVSSLGTSVIYTTQSKLILGTDADYFVFESWDGQLDDIRIYNRALTESEIRLLASERGIAYKQRNKKIFRVSAATTNAAWLSGRNVLITPGIK